MEDENKTKSLRIVVNVFINNNTTVKCYIYLDLKKIRYIKDIEKRIMSLFNLNVVSLFINDIWLPSNETVKLIRGDDIIIAKSVSYLEVFNNIQVAPEEELNCVPRKRKKKASEDISLPDISISDDVSIQGLQACLEGKKMDIIQQLEEKNDNSSIQTNEIEKTSCFDHSYSSAETKFKKKRIRKHKKKPIKDPMMMGTLYPLTNLLKETKTFLSQHTRFSDDGKKDNSEEILQEVGALENMSIDNVPNEECVSKEDVTVQKSCQSPQKVSRKSEDSINLNGTVQTVTTELESNKEGNSEVPAENGTVESNVVTTADNGNECADQQSNDDWKNKLLSLAQNKEKESKVFHRKLSN